MAEVKGFSEHFDGFKRHLKLALAVFVAVVGVGVGFAYSLPDIYKSTGYILIEEPAIPEAILRSTVSSYAAKQLTTLNETILTNRNLVRFIEDFDLYPIERLSTPAELLANKVKQSISLDVQRRDSVGASGLPQVMAVGFTISFEDENPQKAQQVAEELVGLYIEGNTKIRSEQTAETADFLAGEVRELEAEIGELEAGLATFKEENAQRLPSLNALNMNQMQRIEQTLLQLEGELQSLQQVKISIESQLTTIDPSTPVRLADGTYALSPADQLKQLQTQLTVYQSRYSADHPDVVATKRDIASLRQRFGIDVDVAQLDEQLAKARAELALAEEKYSPDHPDVLQSQRKVDQLDRELVTSTQRMLDGTVEPDNPAYIQLTGNLATINAEEGAIKSKMSVLRAQMLDYEQRLMETPQVEKELASLSRTLSSTSNRYWVMRDKQFAAEVGETLETESKGEEMILIESPRVPLRPYKPNRGAIITLAALFALVAGIGITQLADSIDRSIRSSAAVVSVQGVPPLVEVPYIYTEEELAQGAKLKKMGLYSLAPALLLVIVVVHFTVLPLDLLWYSIASRIGL